MFIYKPQFHALSKRGTAITRLLFVRHSSSSSSSSTDKLENEKVAAKPTTKSGQQQQQQQKPFNLVGPKIPFMPVINIPETEFAHNAFFSLHRPLLGLSDEEETPFFSNKSEEQDQDKLDDVLASYMMDLQPFVKPAAPGAELLDTIVDKRGVAFEIIESNEEFVDDFLVGQQEDAQTHSLPMYHMPESGDVLDYLTSIESNMKAEHAKLDAQDNAKALRLKKLEMIDSTKRYSQSKPRFYANSSSSRHLDSRLRRYQQKWNLKD